MREINKIVIHHTGSSILGPLDSPKLVKLRHKYLRGFDDIGYHYLIGNGYLTGDGEIYQGRDIERIGAHAKGHNQDSLGIALIGNYNISKPTEKQWESLIELLYSQCDMYDLQPRDIYGHKELEGTDTSCPGRNINMDKVRRDVALYKALEEIRIVRFSHRNAFFNDKGKNEK